MNDPEDRIIGALESWAGSRQPSPGLADRIVEHTQRRSRRRRAGLGAIVVVLVGTAIVVPLATLGAGHGQVVRVATSAGSATPSMPNTTATAKTAPTSRHGAITKTGSSPTRQTVSPAIFAPSSGSSALGQPCGSNSLSIHGGRQGGGGPGAHGDVIVTNTGTKSCLMSGLPAVTLISHLGLPLSITAVPPTNELTPTTLKPGAAADLVIFWSNWCAEPPGALQIRLTLPSGGAVTGPFNGPPDYNYVPGCLSPGQPSNIKITYAYASTSGISPSQR